MNIPQMSRSALNSSVKVRAPTLRRCALSFENACSMGFRSGEYGGRWRNQQPACLDGFGCLDVPVCRKVVQDDNTAGYQFRHQNLFDVGGKGRPVHRPRVSAGRNLLKTAG